jgi:hypothetical protein
MELVYRISDSAQINCDVYEDDGDFGRTMSAEPTVSISGIDAELFSSN